MHPKEALIEKLLSTGETERFGIWGPTVVMTEALPFEGKLEGYRSLILKKCKVAFLEDLFEYKPFSDAGFQDILVSGEHRLDKVFDCWWTAEEIYTLEIKTDW
jgi:hypothetical protein